MANKLYVFNGTTHTDITRAAANYTANGWNFTVLNGIVVFNNGVDNPQSWDGGANAVNLDYDATNTWDAMSYKAKVIRAFKNFLVALYITEGANTYPHMVHWSNAADTGDLPTDWDYTDTTNEAGRVELSDTPGVLVDALPLHDSMIIYKEDAIHIMNFIGGTFQFSFFKVSDAYGLLAQDCVCEVNSKHFVVGRDYVYMHDGNTIETILDKTNQDYFNADVDKTNYEKTFVVFYKKRHEVWICYPSSGNTYCNKALIFNVKTGAQTFRDLPDLIYAAPGQVNDPQKTWADMSDTWTVEDDHWNTGINSKLSEDLIGISTTDIYRFDDGYDNDGTAVYCYARKQGIQLGGVEEINTVLEVFPRMKGTGTVQIRVGSQMHVYDVPKWTEYKDFTPGVDDKVDVRSTGALHAIEVRSEANIWWRLAGFEFNFEKAGEI